MLSVRNFLWSLKHGVGSSSGKRRRWNNEFESGRWDFIEDTSDDIIYSYLARYAGGSSILDLGCGSGNTGCEMAPGSYSNYTGVDISEVAVEKASDRALRAGRRHNNCYVVGDILSFVPPQLFQVIVFRESLYYIPWYRIRALLKRYSEFLLPEGVFIIRCHRGSATAHLCRIITKDFHVIEERAADERGPLILVFRHAL